MLSYAAYQKLKQDSEKKKQCQDVIMPDYGKTKHGHKYIGQKNSFVIGFALKYASEILRGQHVHLYDIGNK